MINLTSVDDHFLPVPPESLIHIRKIGIIKIGGWGFRKGQPDAAIAQSIRSAQEQLKAFADLGGEVLFGTDVGYMTDFDPMDEYVYMAEAGLSFGEILASLTTAPARRFGMKDRTGRLVPGMNADLVILDGDPVRDVTAFASIDAVMRNGRFIYE